MTDVQQRALDLLNESRIAFGLAKTDVFFRDQTPENEALCRALERQEPAMTSELRPAVDVAQEAGEEWERYGPHSAVAIIEADREAVRAEVVREIAAWLRHDEDPYPDSYDIADEIEAKFGASHDR